MPEGWISNALMQSGDEYSLKCWKVLCDISRIQFKAVYDRLHCSGLVEQVRPPGPDRERERGGGVAVCNRRHCSGLVEQMHSQPRSIHTVGFAQWSM